MCQIPESSFDEKASREQQAYVGYALDLHPDSVAHLTPSLDLSKFSSVLYGFAFRKLCKKANSTESNTFKFAAIAKNIDVIVLPEPYIFIQHNL